MVHNFCQCVPASNHLRQEVDLPDSAIFLSANHFSDLVLQGKMRTDFLSGPTAIGQETMAGELKKVELEGI